MRRFGGDKNERSVVLVLREFEDVLTMLEFLQLFDHWTARQYRYELDQIATSNI